jgi:hypothetical protein
VSASATFTRVAGGIEISVTNTQMDMTSQGQAISYLRFTVGGNLSLPTAFTRISGDKAMFTQGGMTDLGFHDYSPVSSDPDLHWNFTTGGSNLVRLVNVDFPGESYGLGGQPEEMIAAHNANFDSNPANFNAYWNGTANFFLSASSLPSDLTVNDITSVQFAFGTGPETQLLSGTAVSEPSSRVLVLSGLVGLGFAGACRLRRSGTGAGVRPS